MGRRKIKIKRKDKVRKTPTALMVEYYQLPFLLMGEELMKQGYSMAEPHQIRRDFWSVVPPARYDPMQGRDLVETYLKRVDGELRAVISSQSTAYWLHLYRRIGIGSAGRNDEPATIANVRATFEAAVQKFAKEKPCDRIGNSAEISPKDILNGILLSPELKTCLDAAQAFPQLVLTRFGVNEMRELYDAEKLAYEGWKCMAALRILGKGAFLVVDHERSELFYDDRSDELNTLVAIYDDRSRDPGHSATGTVFENKPAPGESSGYLLLPSYNVTRVPASTFKAWFERVGINLRDVSGAEFVPNFLWWPFNIRGYFRAHEPFWKGFEEKHKISLSWVLSVMAALASRVLQIWLAEPSRTMHYWQRAYSGPDKIDFMIEEINTFLPAGIAVLGTTLDASAVDVEKVFQFLLLTQPKRDFIDVGLAGPHSMLLPFGEDRIFVDYAWCHRFLYNIFFGIKVDDERDFKGEALERLVHRGQSALPIIPCRADDGSQKQIDAAFALGDALVICECKAVWRSLGIERGNHDSIAYRDREVVERSLTEADAKAGWLKAHPHGSNYDVTGYRSIIPLGVSPFVEYIPSLNTRYWLKEGLPRVLAPHELEEFLGSMSATSAMALDNVIELR